MSSQKGNTTRKRPQKHQNSRAFKNNLYDTSHTTKKINSTNVSNVCQRCKEIIEWKIKYKKYKPLTQPKKCVKCEQRTVKQAYHVMCTSCGEKLKICTKCCEAKEVIQPLVPNDQEKNQLDKEMQAVIRSLPERKRRTFFRYLEKMNKEKEVTSNEIESKDKQNKDLATKLQELKLASEDVDDSDDFCSDDFDKDSSDNENNS